MNENLDAYGKSFSKQELEIERALRPEAFESFAGQEQVVENLLIFTRAASWIRQDNFVTHHRQ